MTKDDRDKLNEVHTWVKDIRAILYDNGQPGLITQFKELQTQHNDNLCKKDSWVIWSLAFLNVVVLVFALLK